MESITAYFRRTEPDDIKRQARFKELAERFYFVMACDTTYDIRPELRDAGGEWVSYDDDPPENPLRTIVIRQSDGRATDSPYGLLEDIWTHCRKVILGFCEPDWDGLLRHAYITEPFAREWEQAAHDGQMDADSESAAPTAKPTTPRLIESQSEDIPGKFPNNSIGQMAVKAAWDIEKKTGRAASNKDVMNLLQQWAKNGDHPAILIQPLPAKRAVMWMTKDGKEKAYDEDACGKTLDTWKRSRAPSDTSRRIDGE